jgi:hypothetical protein
MTIFLPDAPLWYLQVAAVARDTLLVRPVPPIRTTFEQTIFVAQGILVIFAVFLIPLSIYGALVMRKAALAAEQKIDALLGELRPLAAHVKEASVAVKETAEMVRTDVAMVHDTVQVATERVKQTVVQLADRVDDFNDLLGNVHEKASMAIDVAGTAMSGLAWGARTLRDRRAARKAKKRSRDMPQVKDLDALDG